MTDQQEREYPVRVVKHPVTGEPEMAFSTDFTAWLMDISPDQLRAAYALHGKIPPEMLARGKRKREQQLGTDDMGDAIEAYMRGEV